MALDTKAGLVTNLQDFSTYSDLTAANYADFITWAHQEIKRRLRANAMLASADIAVSAETASRPAGFLAFKRAYLDTSPRRKLMTASAETVMDLATQYVTQTYPEYVAVEGSLLRFGPQFSWTGTVKALYYKAPDELTDDDDTNAILLAYPYVYLFGAMEALHIFKEDDEQADRWGGKFGALIEDINNRDAKDTMSGPLQSMPYGGGVI